MAEKLVKIGISGFICLLVGVLARAIYESFEIDMVAGLVLTFSAFCLGLIGTGLFMSLSEHMPKR